MHNNYGAPFLGQIVRVLYPEIWPIGMAPCDFVASSLTQAAFYQISTDSLLALSLTGSLTSCLASLRPFIEILRSLVSVPPCYVSWSRCGRPAVPAVTHRLALSSASRGGAAVTVSCGTNDCSAGARSSSSEARRPPAAGASLAPNYRRPGRKPCGGEALVSVARCYVGIAYALRCRKCSVIKQNCP